MEEIYHILKTFFGYSSFRSNQEDIISSVIDGKDTVALLPTGGGKSICFQIPALHFSGLTIVISPLISLMEDQVFHLKEKGIKAECIHSGLSPIEIASILDKCEFGKLKFLYLSPERLESRDFKTRSKQFNISLIAIDEAHCISQWGYDFRPSYLKIKDFLELHPESNRIAVTATAKPKVLTDIIEKLEFKEEKVFKSSFERENLSYHTVEVNNKDAILQHTLNKYPGAAIVYCYSRREVKRVCRQLQLLGFSADFYHGGLNTQIRKEKQEKWILDETRIMVATNAFGMGIDKSDVRIVFHYDLPENIENYFQEAGRAGRDLKESKAILAFEKADITTLKERTEKKFIEKDKIREVYDKLFQHNQIALDTGQEEEIEFNILEFSKKYDFDLIETYNSVKFLENCGYLILKDKNATQSKIKFITDNETIYQFQISNPNYDAFIRYLARSYAGIYDHHIPFQLENFSKHLKTSYKRIIEQLDFLYKHEIIDYTLQTNNPRILFTQNRKKPKQLNLTNYQFLKDTAFENLEIILSFIENKECRSKYLRKYFGDETNDECGKCSYCKRNQPKNNDSILQLIGDGIDFSELLIQSDLMEAQLIEILNHLIDEGKVSRDENKFNFLNTCK